jgi:hypothetical protein
LLACLKEHVGTADAFVSHVQKLPLRVFLESLKNGEREYGVELLEDKATMTVLRKTALQDFLREQSADTSAETVIERCQSSWASCEEWCSQHFNATPALVSITAHKPAPPKYFIDYACIRQCLKHMECLDNDFTINRVVNAIATIGTTIFELTTDLKGETALPRRLFCVLELFATIKAKGRLLVCGPAMQDPEKVMMLAEMAANSDVCKDVMDSARAECRWKEEEVLIRKYIETSLGYERADRVVLSAIVTSCVKSATAVGLH